MRVAVDVMGGDHAPAAILDGCFAAAEHLDGDDQVLLVGDQATLQSALDDSDLSAELKARYRVVHASQTVAMDESPAAAIRGKPDSSISVAATLVSKGEADVFISAGNTGACVAAAQLRMRNLPGVERAGIAVPLPTSHGPVVICDVGANVEPRPSHLQQYAMMASAYCTSITGKERPRVGLLSMGEEDAKGNDTVKQAVKLLRDEPQINFIGNVEGRDFFTGEVDVVICDGFTGNVVLKFAESITGDLMRIIGGTLMAESPELLPKFHDVAKKAFAKHDWQEFGGAPLLGVNGTCIICHGRSDRKAISNAIRAGKRMTASGINERIVKQVEKAVSL